MCRVIRHRSRRRAGRQMIGTAIVAAVALVACASPVNRTGDASVDASSQGSAAAAASAHQATALLPRSNLSLSDRARWRSILKWPDDCETAFQSSHVGTDSGLRFHELAPQLAVVEVLCAAGSYQSSATLVRFDERGTSATAAILRFPVYESDDGATVTSTESAEIWGEISFDSAPPAMTVLNIARQTGDCGVWTRYDIAGGTPVITEARARLPCPARARPPIRFDPHHPPIGWRRIRNTR
jgi:hypothetical protein